MDEPISSFINDEGTSKALIVQSEDEHKKRMNNSEIRQIYYDIYWCMHSYNYATKIKSLLPLNAFAKNENENKRDKKITGSKSENKNKNKKKRDRKEIQEEH